MYWYSGGVLEASSAPGQRSPITSTHQITLFGCIELPVEAAGILNTKYIMFHIFFALENWMNFIFEENAGWSILQKDKIILNSFWNCVILFHRNEKVYPILLILTYYVTTLSWRVWAGVWYDEWWGGVSPPGAAAARWCGCLPHRPPAPVPPQRGSAAAVPPL